MIDWGRPKLLAMTLLDNASFNNSVLKKKRKKKIKHKKDSILEHEFLHIQYRIHILNLIVHDELKQYDGSIANVINMVKYVRS